MILAADRQRAVARALWDELVVDNFAGGGGASLGIEQALGRPVDLAINHDAQAVAMHRTNHPHTRHLTEDVWDVDPLEATRGRPVGLAWFSPDCKHFSKAKGGRPVDKRIRGLAWVVVRWARRVRPRVILLENVEEFVGWGPLTSRGTPCPRRRGWTFRTWVRRLRKLGYAVEWRELLACDYGAPTIRKRLFLAARCDGEPIVWPEPTHGPSTARDHHSLVGASLLKLYGSCRDGAPLEAPAPTVTAQGQHLALVQAFLAAHLPDVGPLRVAGEPCELVDVGMRMLAPRELFRAQGFPDSYEIEHAGGARLSKTAQVRMCGNSVCPDVARALVAANVRLATTAA